MKKCHDRFHNKNFGKDGNFVCKYIHFLKNVQTLFCNKHMQFFTAFILLEELQTVSKFGSIFAFLKFKAAVSFHTKNPNLIY